MKNINEIINDTIKYKNYEKITSGERKGTIKSIEVSQTEKTKKSCLKYVIEIENSKGYKQDVVITDLLTDESAQYTYGRFTRLLLDTKVITEEEIAKVDNIDSLLDLSSKLIGKSVIVEFVKKIVNNIPIIDKTIIVK